MASRCLFATLVFVALVGMITSRYTMKVMLTALKSHVSIDVRKLSLYRWCVNGLTWMQTCLRKGIQWRYQKKGA
eukprot:scaffold11656_cov163-Amphora_coffeaeformis.AAC.3